MNDWVVETPSFEEDLMNNRVVMLNQNGVNRVVEIIKEKDKEIERLHTIIKEVREYVEKCSILGVNEVDSYCMDYDVRDDLLRILEKENNMKVGDYVRTEISSLNLQRIGKIKKIISEDFIHTDIGTYDKENIIKSSPNIIDLIEVGDYVNGNKIVHIQEEEFPNYPKRLLFAGVDENNIDDVWEVYNKDDIKSIVPKEQFESMEYKIGE